MSSPERRLLAERGKLDALRERLVQTRYLTTAEVARHLNVSRRTLYTIPTPVLPWVPIHAGQRITRRYHPADVAAYPGRAHRWHRALLQHREAEELAAMEAEREARHAELIAEALTRLAL